MLTNIKPRSAFAAAVHVLSYDTVARHMDKFIARDDERINWEGIIEWRNLNASGGEKVIIDAAFALWNGGWEKGRDTIGNIMRDVSDEPYRLLIEAMLALRPLKYAETDDPTEDIRLVPISRWQADAIRTAGSVLSDYAGELTEDQDPESMRDLAGELVEIRKGWDS